MLAPTAWHASRRISPLNTQISTPSFLSADNEGHERASLTSPRQVTLIRAGVALHRAVETTRSLGKLLLLDEVSLIKSSRLDSPFKSFNRCKITSFISTQAPALSHNTLDPDCFLAERRGVWEGWKAAFGLSRLSTRRHFHGSL